MNRRVALVASIAVVLVLVAYYFLLWQPKSADLAEIEEQIEQAQTQQITLQQRINRLEDIRNSAPDLEAAIVAAETVVPRGIAVPAALRQLVTAADDSGVNVVQVSPARPAPFTAAEQPGLAIMNVSLQVDGGYFQLVDFLRRIEDPTITPRGFVWTSISVNPSDYPTLTANVTGAMFALLPTAAEETVEETAEEATEEAS